MVLGFNYSVLLLCLLLLTCDHGDAVKDLKEKYCDEEEGKTSSLSSYIARLESKYKPAYVVDESDEKIARLESKYRPDYGVDETEGKSSSPSSYIARLESKYKPAYVVDEADEKTARLESKYKPGYGVDETEGKSSSPSSSIAHLESKYKPGYVVDEADEKIARLESKYKPGYVVYEAEEKIARLESRYKPGYGVDEAKEKSSFPSSYITRLENKYKPSYVADETAEKSSSLRSYITDLESKYKPSYIDDEAEEKSLSQPSSKMMEHHSMENHGDDDIGSEEVGVFTIDDVHAFHVGRKLSTFFSIRNPSLYPGFLPREMADSIPFSSSETSKILQFFSVSPESPKGKAIKDTLRTCEIEPAKGETKICATSSESMLEFLKNAFGEADFKLISTSHPTMTTPILQSYTILEPPREIESPKKVACHPLQYLYAIYMCHYDAYETKIFKVLLVGDNGDKVDALIVCHMDTSAWSPKHTAFSLLGTKPGIPVCHAFSEGHGVWIESSTPVATI